MAGNKLYTAGDNRTDPGNVNQGEGSVNQDYWLQVARDAYTQSNDYFDSNVRKQIEANLAHFANRHAPGSKYYKDLYKHRHKGFRPKTRSMVRKKEAMAALAMFSTSDIVTVTAERARDKAHQVSASINQELLQYRLDNTIPWFQTVVGAYQDSMNTGVCISHQYWDYQEQTTRYPQTDEQGNEILDEATGDPLMFEDYKIIKDSPAVDLRPIENVLFSASADWRDPLGTSPFLIDKIPMTIDEVKAMTKKGKTGRIPWFELTDSQLMKGVTSDSDPIRQQRENQREDSTDQSYTEIGFLTVWVHRNIINKDGRDWIYYTLGVFERLSDPIPLEDEYPWLRPGERPYKMGFSIIETHKTYPDSIVGLSAKTQQEANEINNQRRDNVALVLNRRYFVRKSARINYASLQRNVPGGVTEMDDVNQDIKSDAPPDVTASSYQEQDRVNMDFDELTGHFSTSSVGTNRNLNETVGGMNLLSGNADALTEYPLRTFVETWVKPVLKQLIRLEQRHETDRALLQLMGEKLQVWQKYGINAVTDAWIQGSMNVKVNVGFGSSNPEQRVQKLAMGLNTVLGFTPQLQGRLDAEEVASEVFGALGYDSHERFFPEQEEGAEQPPMGPQPEPMSEFEQAKLQLDREMAQAKLDDAHANRVHQLEMKYLDKEERLEEQFMANQITREQMDTERTKIATDRQNKVDEMRVRLKTGAGI